MKTSASVVDDTVKAAERWLGYQVRMRDLPGFSFGIMYDGRLVRRMQFGFEDIASGRRTGPDTSYRMASVTKLFTATAIMQLAEAGKISIDGALSKYLPCSEYGEWLRGVTVKDLLTHMGGITREAGNGDCWSISPFPGIPEIKAYCREKSISVFGTGERFKYSNLGFVLLGQIVEQAARLPYGEYVRRNILAPLQMENSLPDLAEELPEHLATAYGRRIPGKERAVHLGRAAAGFAAAAGLISTVEDLSKFLAANLDGVETILTDESKRNMRRLHAIKDDSTNWGLGYTIYKIAGREVLGHWGLFTGMTTGIALHPESRMGVIALCNAMDGPLPLAFKSVFNLFFLFQDSPEEEDGEAAGYCGLYSHPEQDVLVVQAKGSLFCFNPAVDNPAESAMRLRRTGDGQFIIDGSDGGESVGEAASFEAGPDGAPAVLWLGDYRFVRNPESA